MKYPVNRWQKQALLATALYRCDICGVIGDTRTLHVDHNHDTGDVRGILCSSCNLGLGHFRTVVNLAHAVEYLQRAEVLGGETVQISPELRERMNKQQEAWGTELLKRLVEPSKPVIGDVYAQSEPSEPLIETRKLEDERALERYKHEQEASIARILGTQK